MSCPPTIPARYHNLHFGHWRLRSETTASQLSILLSQDLWLLLGYSVRVVRDKSDSQYWQTFIVISSILEILSASCFTLNWTHRECCNLVPSYGILLSGVHNIGATIKRVRLCCLDLFFLWWNFEINIEDLNKLSRLAFMAATRFQSHSPKSELERFFHHLSSERYRTRWRDHIPRCHYQKHCSKGRWPCWAYAGSDVSR